MSEGKVRRRIYPKISITGIVVKPFAKSIDYLSELVVNNEKDINDNRMYPTRGGSECVTCFKRDGECIGHLARIEYRSAPGDAAENIPIPLASKLVVNLMNVFCPICGALRINEDAIEANKKLSCFARLELFSKKAIKVCAGPITHTNLPIYKIVKGVISKIEQGAKPDVPFPEIYRILTNLTDEQVRILGFKSGVHPRDYCPSSFPVIPSINRPAKHRPGWSKANPDAIDEQYAAMIKANSKREWKDIYMLEGVITGTAKKKTSDKAMSQFQSLDQRCTGKNGYIRGFTLAKRVNFGARAPLGPTSKFGVPFGSMLLPNRMRALTSTEVIHSRNFRRAQAWMDQDIITCVSRITLEGTKKMENVKFWITRNPGKKYQLQLGDVIHRTGLDGDYVIFNRQPTLDKHSFMSYKVKFSEKNNICLHSSSTTPHNADNDGDEGNIHKVQTIGAEVECRLLMNSDRLIMGGYQSAPKSGIVFHGMLGAYLMTTDEKYFEIDVRKYISDDVRGSRWSDFLERCEANESPSEGCKYASVIFPRDFFYKDGSVTIENGIITRGELGKNVGNVTQGIVHCICQRYGQGQASKFITEGQYIFDEYVQQRGFSIGISDFLPDSLNWTEHDRLVSEVKLKYQKDLNDSSSRAVGAVIDEQQTIAHLSSITVEVGSKCIKLLSESNNLKKIIASGSKGKKDNLYRIAGIVGQQHFNGERAHRSQYNERRSISWCQVDDDDPSSRGYISSGYAQGLTPVEFFFASQASRVGIASSAIQTPQAGTIRNRAAASMGDFKTSHSGAVISAKGEVIQSVYGGDGFKPSKLIPVNVGGCQRYCPTDISNFIDFLNESD
jgi:DNA-directed RNA polymerase beta' subunit